MGSWEIRIVLPEFSTCFTLHAICLTLTLPAKLLTELSLHPCGLREILFGLMGIFFFSWFGAGWAYYMFQSQMVRLVLFPEGTQVLPLMCMNLESNLLQSSEGFEVRHESRRSVCAHARTHTHTPNINMCSDLSRCAAQNKEVGCASSLTDRTWCSGSTRNNRSNTMNQQVFVCKRSSQQGHLGCLVAELNLQEIRCKGKLPLWIIFHIPGKVPVSRAEKLSYEVELCSPD